MQSLPFRASIASLINIPLWGPAASATTIFLVGDQSHHLCMTFRWTNLFVLPWGGTLMAHALPTTRFSWCLDPGWSVHCCCVIFL